MVNGREGRGRSHAALLPSGSHLFAFDHRLAALKEYAFMKALGEHGFPVPQV